MPVAGFFAALIGPLVAKKRGIYFALITTAISGVFSFIAFRWDEVAGGETGLSGIDRLEFGIPGLLPLRISTPISYYCFVLVIFIVCTLPIWRIVHSPFGTVLQAIRENDVRASDLGYRTAAYRWAAFAFVLDWTQSGNVVMMALLGGGTVNGEDITHLPVRQVVRRGSSRSFQIINLFSELTLYENVWLGVQSQQGHGPEILSPADALQSVKEETERIIREIGLPGREQLPVKPLSYGDRRILEITSPSRPGPRCSCWTSRSRPCSPHARPSPSPSGPTSWKTATSSTRAAPRS